MGSLSHPHLPPKDSADIRLDLLTPQELLAQTNANSSEWSGALNKEQYFRREKYLSNQDLTRDGRLTAWGLIYQPNGAETRQVLAGCETYAKKGLVVRAGGKVEEGVVHGVGSVFSPPDFRGQGYAGRMMRDLGERLRTWQTEAYGQSEQAIASVLFSDIGKKFYAARGWKAFPSAHVALPPKEHASIPDLPEVRLLRGEDLPPLCETDQHLLRRRLDSLKGCNTTAVALLPDLPTIRWHHAREDFVANELFGQKPEIKGAVVGSREGERVWCYLTRVFTNPAKEEPVLHILRLVMEDPSFSDFDAAPKDAETRELEKAPVARAIAALFAAAQAQAASWGMKEVVMWNPSRTVLAGARVLEGDGVGVVEREEDSIASLFWFGDGAGEVEWVGNEKYGWC